MNILAVGANPDDVEFLCSGTLALYSQAGHDVSICYLTTGDKGGEFPPAEMAAIRKKEAQNAAALINAAVYPLDVPDGEVEECLELRRKIVGIIRQTEPDVIITHYDKDYMSDHNCTSVLVSDAAFWSMVAGFKGLP